jgi:formylglycine-generating enzyme required for sulfatase activity
MFPASTGPSRQVITNSIGMRLTLIPAGEFVMGTPRGERGASLHERPAHRVRISRPFHLGVYEVTQDEFQRVMGSNPSRFRHEPGQDTRRFPVESVTWEEAVAFCRKLTARPEEMEAQRMYRLPTEAEWEYACRAGTTTPFSFGNALASLQANFDGAHPYGAAAPGPYRQRLLPVGSFKANAFGLYDMHGNVFEWCADPYARDYYRKAPAVDPPGPAEGPHRVLRGGGWNSAAMSCRSGERTFDAPTRRYAEYGFRTACSARKA